MKVELHIIQSFAPGNLNRDDTGAPKECHFGGHRRARISSQCIKRAVRKHFSDNGLLQNEELGVRTRLLAREAAQALVTGGRDEKEAKKAATAAIKAMGLDQKKDSDRTQYLVFLNGTYVNRFSELCEEHWEELLSGNPGDEAEKAFKGLLEENHTADIALFGRMLADVPGKNIDAACQVAHAISTHGVEAEFDYYTAVDDLQEDEEEEGAGAGMIGTIEFNSACYYRYSNVDLGQLEKNLCGDTDLARRTLEAYIRSSVEAVPTGKQNSFAAHNPPSFVFAVVRERGLWSLANGFEAPVREWVHDDKKKRRENVGYAANSVTALDGCWKGLAAMYGEKDITGKWWLSSSHEPKSLGERAGSLDKLVTSVLSTCRWE